MSNETLEQMSSKALEQMNRQEILKTFRSFEDEVENVKKYVVEDFKLYKERSAKIEKLRNDAEKAANKFNGLVEEVENLLPGATSAGLASSYHDAHKNTKQWPYWAGFLLPLILLMAGYVWFLAAAEEIEWKTIAIRATTGLPLLWIAWYFQRRISQIVRIKEEYHHKERIMRVYQGFSKQINELSDDEEKTKEQKRSLVSVLIGAIERNPANVLDPSGTFLDSWKKKNEQNETQNEGK